MKSVVSEKWFPPSQLAFYFDSNSWAKGTSLYLQNEVVSAKMTSEAEGWSLQAQVQEGREPTPFQVKAHVRVSDGGNLQAWRSTCTCARRNPRRAAWATRSRRSTASYRRPARRANCAR